jgi:hypothetical protein
MAHFYVSATGWNLGFQWQRAGTNLPGATTSAFSLPNVQLSDGGSYTVTVTNVGGSVTSNPALLTVTPPASPRLNMSVLGGSASLSWPLAAAAFQLQSSSDLKLSFTNISAVLVTNASAVSATVPVTGNQRFFRLKKL